MPELPDVEIFKRYVEGKALGRTVAHVTVSDARILGDLPAKQFADKLTGARLEAARRHGKHLLVRLSKGGWLTLHFGMTGGLHYFTDVAEDPPYDRVRLDFGDGGHLAYTNRRMLGRVGFTEDADGFIKADKLGPDLLDPAFDLAAFKAALAGAKRDIKTVLMDQALMAGIGNIYADEILFQARLHPQLPAASLTPAQIETLFRAAKEVLTTAVASGAGAEIETERLPKHYLLRHREAGGKCPRCGGKIEALKVGGRTSYLCPRCQPAPGKKPAARARTR
jgi:formamidopyrimidine-DNA glycosylase